MKVFITGATGYVGNRLLNRLLEAGHDVHALIRSPRSDHLPDHKALTWFPGDTTDKTAVTLAMQGCDVAFSMAAYARVWARSPWIYYHNNVAGAVNIFQCAYDLGIKRVIHTSTAGIYTLNRNGDQKEYSSAINHNSDHYVISKLTAEHAAMRFSRLGLDVIILNPSRVYGPGVKSKSNPFGKVIRSLNKVNILFVPGDGRGVGSYCYIDDVVNAHMRAMYSGKSGEVYLLGGENLSLNEVFENIRACAGTHPLVIHIPLLLCRFIAWLDVSLARVSHHEPHLSKHWIERLKSDHTLSSTKATRELGYRITPFIQGIQVTFHSIFNATPGEANVPYKTSVSHT